MSARLRSLVALVIATLPFVGWASAQVGPDTRITLVGETVRTVAPGRTGTALFQVEHSGDEPVDSQLEIRLPPDWSVSARPAPARLEPGSEARRLVGYRVPETALPGVGRIAVALLDASGDTLSTASALVRVSERRMIAVEAVPGVQGTGATSVVEFRILNHGNTIETMDLAAVSSMQLPVLLDRTEIRLEPFSGDIVTLETLEPEISVGIPHYVLIAARAHHGTAEPIAARAVARTDGEPLAWADAWPDSLDASFPEESPRGTTLASVAPLSVLSPATGGHSGSSNLPMTVSGSTRGGMERTGLLNIGSEWRLSEASSLRAEYGLGARGDRTGTGLSTQLRHADRSGRLDVQYQSGSGDYPGSAKASRQVSASAIRSIGEVTSLQASFGQVRRSSGTTNPATTTGYSQLGTGFRFRPFGDFRASASFSANHRFRDHGPAGDSRSEAFGVGSFTLTHPLASARITIDQGRTTGDSGTDAFLRSDIAVSFRWNMLDLKGSWTWEDGPRYTAQLESERSQWSVAADVTWSPGFRTGIRWFANAFEDPSVTRSRSIDGKIEVEVSRGHRIAAQASLARVLRSAGNETDLRAGLSYSMPVGRPDPVRRESVAGRILLASSGKPVAGALVALGSHVTRSGPDGRFAFPPTASGSRLQVGARSESRPLVVLNPEALRACTADVGCPPVEILLGTGASIAGSLVTAGGHPEGSLAVVATDGLVTRHAIADADGRFAIEGLAPGTWTVSLDDRDGTARPDIVWVSASEEYQATLTVRRTDDPAHDGLARLRALGILGRQGIYPMQSTGLLAPGTAGQIRHFTTFSPVSSSQWVR